MVCVWNVCSPYAGKFEARTRKAGLHLWYKIYFDEEVNLDLAARVLSDVSEITDVEPVCLPTADAAQFPYSDIWFGWQWDFCRYAGSDLERELGPLAVSSDIDVVEAWEIEKGRKEVIVAVVDTKVDIGHPELSANLWMNNNEWPDGVDNDNNGYVDDVYGYGVSSQEDARYTVRMWQELLRQKIIMVGRFAVSRGEAIIKKGFG